MRKHPVSRSDKYRILWLSLGLFALFAILVAQFYRLQIIEGEKWSKKARKQHYFIVKEPFMRGRFFSNNSLRKGHPEKAQSFVVDVQKFHLYIDPESIPANEKDPIARNLMRILKLPAAEQQKLRKQFDRKSRSRRVAMWLDSQTRDAILAWWSPYSRQQRIVRNALFFVNDYQRSYPFNKLLGQVLHTVQSQKDEITKQAIPTGGLELYFNSYLKGKQGKRRLMRSPRNSLETGEVIVAPENGADVYLTINHFLQAIVEEELEKGVKKCKAKRGWATMMNPFTGEIYAMAQYPFFYPQEYHKFFNDPELIEHTHIMPITYAIEPGSVTKPITVSIALMANKELKKRGEAPLFSMDEKIPTANGRFPGRPKPLTDTHLHYYLNMNMGLQKSSNIYMARLMERVVARLGNEWYRDKLYNIFRFGQKTGIELPAESIGLLPTPGKKHPNGALEWSKATPYSLAMGYNYQANSLQLMRAHALFANGGYWIEPTLIRKIVRQRNDGTEEVILDHTARNHQPSQSVLDPEIIKLVVNGMLYVTKPGGTAPRGNIWGYTEAGKTSTSKKFIGSSYSEKLYRGTFIGFTPVDKPAFLLYIVMDEPQYGFEPGVGKLHNGGTCAAPVFRNIATRALAYLGIPPDDPHGYPKGDPRHDSEKAHWLPESRRLQEMYESWNNVKH